MQVTITRTVDYRLDVPQTDTKLAAQQALALFGSMSPTEREQHIR